MNLNEGWRSTREIERRQKDTRNMILMAILICLVLLGWSFAKMQSNEENASKREIQSMSRYMDRMADIRDEARYRAGRVAGDQR